MSRKRKESLLPSWIPFFLSGKTPILNMSGTIGSISDWSELQQYAQPVNHCDRRCPVQLLNGFETTGAAYRVARGISKATRNQVNFVADVRGNQVVSILLVPNHEIILSSEVAG